MFEVKSHIGSANGTHVYYMYVFQTVLNGVYSLCTVMNAVYVCDVRPASQFQPSFLGLGSDHSHTLVLCCCDVNVKIVRRFFFLLFL